MGQNEALKIFATALNTQERFEALLEIVKDRGFIHRSANTPEFDKGLAAMATAAKEPGGGRDRLLAVVALSRIRAIVKSLHVRIEGELANVLESPLPPLSDLSNPDDRFYVAQACDVAWQNWMSDYLAKETVMEETAEKPRAEYVRALLSHSQCFDDILINITDKITDWKPETESPGDSAARRLRRIIAAFRLSIRDYTGEVSPEIGKVLGNLIRTAFRSAGSPDTTAVAVETTDEVAGVIHDLIRARFSLATEETTYDAIRVCSTWFQQTFRWQNYLKSSESIRLVVRDLIEGISILARQGVTDPAVRMCLSFLLGSREEAHSAMVKLVTSLSNVQPEVREWWASGGINDDKHQHSRSVLAEESHVLTENAVLAEILVDTERLLTIAHLVEKDILPEMRMLSPTSSRLVEKYLAQGRALGDSVRAFAARRHLRTRENLDAVVEYSPLDHELLGGARQGIRQVRVIRPVVEQVPEGAIPFVIRKGLVEEI